MPYVGPPGGGGSATWESAAGQFKIVGAAIAAGDQVLVESKETDGAAQVAHIIDTANAFSTAGAKLLSVRNNGGEEFYIDKDGVLGLLSPAYIQIASAQIVIQKDANEFISHLNLGDGGWRFKGRRVALETWNNTAGGLDDGVVSIGPEVAARGHLRIYNQGTTKAGIAAFYDEDGANVSFAWSRDQGAFPELRTSRSDPGTDDTTGQLLGPNANAEIYCRGESTAQVTSATPGNYDKITGFTNDVGLSTLGLTEAAASDKITADVGGKFKVWFQATFSGDNARTYSFVVCVNGVEQDQGACGRYLGTGTDLGSTSFPATVAAAAGQDIDVRVACDAASQDFIPRDMQLCVLRVD